MSRRIDPNGELTDEDRAYLRSRGRNDLVAHIDYMATVDAAVAARKSQDSRSNVNRESSAVLTPEQVDEANADAEAGTEEVDLPYHKWKKAELKEEANARGLSDDGTVDELAARLEANDREDEQTNS